MQGIEKRINKDGSSTYRARVRIKGHPSVSEPFSSLALGKNKSATPNQLLSKDAFNFLLKKKTYACGIGRPLHSNHTAN